MTTYQVISDEDEHHLMASWPDLPSPATHHVTTFQERKLAKATSNVLNAAARIDGIAGSSFSSRESSRKLQLDQIQL